MFHNALQPWHLLVVAIAFIVLFGSKRLPDAARSLGKSLRILKSETRAMRDDGAREAPATGPAPGPATEGHPPVR
ncbi:sec-independent protein translocase tatA/E-like protein [Streptomyces laurentii]|uniref:Sec-independent protein translocase protein TatA n=1 Tax=Streptomyces laurentii TaxID=39478 RepID=A0A160P8B9_STRLU|nr:sec-independent protein translocase tatA/E-like protein [Streptomyces laurentii]